MPVAEQWQDSWLLLFDPHVLDAEAAPAYRNMMGMSSSYEPTSGYDVLGAASCAGASCTVAELSSV